jgi:hypothetical protein
MPQLLQYRYEVGERWQTNTTTSLLMKDPEAGQVIGQVKTDQVYEVLAGTPEGWKILMMQRLQSKVGPLTEQMPPEQGDKDLIFEMQRDGTLVDLGHGLPSRVPCFPAEPVGQGDSWNVTDNNPRAANLPRFVVTHLVAVEEEREGQPVVDLVLMSEAGDTDQDGSPIKISVEGTATFSIARGRVTYSITRMEMEWANRRNMQTVLEITLVAEEAAVR